VEVQKKQVEQMRLKINYKNLKNCEKRAKMKKLR
jgi:hypothetical protein